MTYTYISNPNWLDLSDLLDLVDDLFFDNSTNKKTTFNRYQNLFSKSIGRPHNMFVEENDGVITKYIVETVYTPYKKSDISVKYKPAYNDSKASVCVSIEKQKDECDSNEKEIYRGISERKVEFEIPLSNTGIKAENIKTTAEDGILRIEMSVPEEIIEDAKEVDLIID